MNWKRIKEIIIKEFRQTFRDPRMRFFLFGPPMVQLIIFGYAVNLDVESSKVAWMDGDRTVASRDLRADFEGSTYFHITELPASEDEAQELLDRGEVTAIISVLPGFSRDLDRGETAPVQILVDGTNSNTASVVSSYAGRVVSGFATKYLVKRQREFQMQAVANSGVDAPRYAALPTVRANTRVWFNEDLRSRNYFVPGILVTNQAVTVDDPNLTDLAPSVLSLYGIVPPAAMTGRVVFTAKDES